jgi:homospermidine synthase
MPPVGYSSPPVQTHINFDESQHLVADQRRNELNMALSEQIDEKKRRVEEEKRQQILEERMEEARLEK